MMPRSQLRVELREGRRLHLHNIYRCVLADGKVNIIPLDNPNQYRIYLLDHNDTEWYYGGALWPAERPNET